MFHLFVKRTRAATRPVIVVTGKIKYDENSGTCWFWPNYARGNGLKHQYDLGHHDESPCKFKNATSIGFFDAETKELLNYTNGVDGAIIHMEK